MDSVLAKIKSVSDNDEEDYENFFLQPSSSPYNIAEKVQNANLALFEENYAENRLTKVKFRENLVDYEPSYTDDDVNSIESDANVDYPDENEIEDKVQILEYKLQDNVNNLDELNSDESIEEEVAKECLVTEKNETENFSVEPENDKNAAEKKNIVENTINLQNEKIKKRKPGTKCFNNNLPHIDCKNHCIERLDCDLNICINKLNLQEKPQALPKLKLQRRECCENNKEKHQPNLPTYAGLYSEYGLSSHQIERREKRKEILLQKEKRRQKLLQEYKEQRTQQNEEVFNRWLREIEKRKQTVQNSKHKNNEVKKYFTPNIISISNNHFQTAKERPKTANGFIPSHNIKRMKRPHTTSSCVFIEVPHNILRRGINIGDLLIASKHNANLSKLHILTFS